MNNSRKARDLSAVIARSEATKQSSRARSAPLKKLFFEARLPARGWIASLRSQ
jgi:hypothetical protein